MLCLSNELSNRQTLVAINSSQNSKVTTILAIVPPLLIPDTVEALAKHVTAQFLPQGRLLEQAEHDLAETKRDLEVYKEAFYNAERDKRDLEERFEKEKQALNDEIRQLRENSMQGCEEGLEREGRDLGDGNL